MIKLHNMLGFRVAALVGLVAAPLMYATAWKIVSDGADETEAELVQKGRVAAMAGARAYAAVLEFGVASKEIKLEDLVDPKYTEIEYPFRVDVRRYHTGFDAFTDANGIQEIEDAVAADPDVAYASGMDHGGYVPTTTSGLANDPIGNKEVDAARSRKKMKYETPVHLAAATFRGNPGNPTLVQEYDRKPGGKTWDVAAPIYVRGQHFGVFRVGIKFDRIAQRRSELAVRVAELFGGFAGLIMLTIFVVLVTAMRPLNRLSGRALAMSIGDDIHVPVASPTIDDDLGEVGTMAASLERLRRGLKILIDEREGRIRR